MPDITPATEEWTYCSCPWAHNCDRTCRTLVRFDMQDTMICEACQGAAPDNPWCGCQCIGCNGADTTTAAAAQDTAKHLPADLSVCVAVPCLHVCVSCFPVSYICCRKDLSPRSRLPRQFQASFTMDDDQVHVLAHRGHVGGTSGARRGHRAHQAHRGHTGGTAGTYPQRPHRVDVGILT